MLTRRALIIASPYSIPQRPLPGVVEDLYGWQDFLKSPLGGAWGHSELSILPEPSERTFAEHRAWMEEADVALVLVAAHGYAERDWYGDVRSRVVLSKTFHPDVEALMPRNPRWSITVVDACRNFVRHTEGVVGGMAGITEAGEPMDLVRHRQLYDALVRVTPPTRELALACSFDESAAEDPHRGGVFSAALRDAAAIGRLPRGGRARRTFRTCVDEAKLEVQLVTGMRQRPLSFHRRGAGASIPFSVAIAPPRMGRLPY